jgi:outer membrane receptor protein involved in Fe transport
MVKRICIYLLLLFLPALPLLSANEAGADTIHLREVEIIRSILVPRSPLISGGLDTLSMELMSGQSLSELLACQPAIHIKSAGRGALSTASFRGTDASHTKVFWNGIRLNSPMLGQVDFSQIPVWIIDKVSILYGGSSLGEGSGALGGSVLLENAVDWNGGFSLSLNQEISSFGTMGTYGRLSAGDDRIRSDTRLYWNRSHNNYPFLNTFNLPKAEVQRLEQAAYKKSGVLQDICIRPGDRQELAIHLWYQESERDLPPLMSQEGASREEMQADRNLRTSLEWKIYPRFGTLSLRSGYSGNRMHYYLYYNGIEYWQFDSESLENSLYNTMEANLRAGSRFRFRFRADLNRHDAGIRDQVRDEGYRHLRNEGGLTASAYADAGGGLVLYTLIRQEWADGKWLPIMPSAGFSYRPVDDLSLNLKGNLARNYNLPSLNDLYWIPGGNPGLKPENSLNGDLSVEFLQERKLYAFKASVNTFAARVDNWILWKPTQFKYWEAENISLVFSRGMDFQLGSDLFMGKWILSLKAAYAFTRSTNEGDTPANDLSRGKQLIYIPVHASSAYLNLSRSGYFLNWSLTCTGQRFTQPANEEHDPLKDLDPYALQDLHIGKTWKMGPASGGLRFSVYNLFNVSYQSVRSRPMPMRSYALTIQMEL